MGTASEAGPRRGDTRNAVVFEPLASSDIVDNNIWTHLAPQASKQANKALDAAASIWAFSPRLTNHTEAAATFSWPI